MRRRLLSTTCALIVLAAGCGGETGDAGTVATTEAQTETTQPATTQAPETTAPPTTSEPVQTASSDDFCRQGGEGENPVQPIDIFSGDLEQQVNEFLEAMDLMTAAAPAEIRDDVAILAEAGRQMAELLEKYDYNVLAIPPEEAAQLEVVLSEEFMQAAENIAEFCGIEIDPGDGTAAPPGIGGDDELPADFPEALVPPGLEGVQNLGPAGLFLTSSAANEDIVAFYEDALGADGFPAGAAVLIQGEFEGQTTIVTVEGDDPVMITVTLAPF